MCFNSFTECGLVRGGLDGVYLHSKLQTILDGGKVVEEKEEDEDEDSQVDDEEEGAEEDSDREWEFVDEKKAKACAKLFESDGTDDDDDFFGFEALEAFDTRL